MARRYQVHNFTWTKHPSPEMVNKTARFVVADWINDEEGDKGKETYRTHIAEFPVDAFRDKESQRELAIKLCNYLNAVLDAQEKAVLDDALLQRIMLPYTPPTP